MIKCSICVLLFIGAQSLDLNDVPRPCNSDSPCPFGYACRYISKLPGIMACIFRGFSAKTTTNKRPGRCPPSWPHPAQVPVGAAACNNHEDCPTNKRCCPSAYLQNAFCVDIPRFVSEQTVTPIVVTDSATGTSSSVTLVTTATGLRILVDTGVQRAPILKNLWDRAGLVAQDIHVVVETHGHPDHFGNSALFQNVDHIFKSNGKVQKYNGRNFQDLPQTNSKYYLTRDGSVEIIETPGHTLQDITVLVRRVPRVDNLTIAMCGDVFQSEKDFGTTAAEDPIKLTTSQNAVKCAADYILPGHGTMFKVDKTGLVCP